jgi:hypothetical protein
MPKRCCGPDPDATLLKGGAGELDEQLKHSSKLPKCCSGVDLRPRLGWLCDAGILSGRNRGMMVALHRLGKDRRLWIFRAAYFFLDVVTTLNTAM